MKLLFHWNKINCKQEKENSSRAWKEAFAYEIILITKFQSKEIKLQQNTRIKQDDLCQHVLAREGQCVEALHHIEHELQRLSIALHPSTPPEPLNDVLKQYMDTLCSAQKQTNFANILKQDIPTFNGNNSTQLEDWLIDIETAADLLAESRKKLAQAKSKGTDLHFNYRSSYLW